MCSKTISMVGFFLACLFTSSPAWSFSPLQSGSRSSGGSSSRSAVSVDNSPASNFATNNLPPSNFGDSINNGGTTFQYSQPYPQASSGSGSRQLPADTYAQPTNAFANAAPAAMDDNVWAINDPYSQISIDHSLWTHFLSQYVITDSQGLNRVRYGDVSAADHQLLNQYLSQMQSVDPRTLNKTEQLAYWINLYNSRTVSIVLENYPVRSIRKIKTNFTDFVGPFNDDVLTVIGQPLTLTTVESGILRPLWKDPRVHYALNCASFGCPNLQKTAWSPFDIESRLDQAAYEYLNSDRAIKLQFFGTRVVATKIFKWYKEDFGGTDQQVLDHVRKYAGPERRNQLQGVTKINGYFYDWSLNDAKVTHPRIFESIRL